MIFIGQCPHNCFATVCYSSIESTVCTSHTVVTSHLICDFSALRILKSIVSSLFFYNIIYFQKKVVTWPTSTYCMQFLYSMNLWLHSHPQVQLATVRKTDHRGLPTGSEWQMRMAIHLLTTSVSGILVRGRCHQETLRR